MSSPVSLPVPSPSLSPVSSFAGPDGALVTVSAVTALDLPAIFDLNARAFGPGRFARTAYRIREGVPLISRFCLKASLHPPFQSPAFQSPSFQSPAPQPLATGGSKLIAAIRFTEVSIGGMPGGLLLGPLAVEPAFAGLGFGRRLIGDGLANAKAAGLGLCVLVGDAPYYARFGFTVLPPGQIVLPGPADPGRMLGAELTPGAFGRYRGPVCSPVCGQVVLRTAANADQ
jgi:predicted N-acetyltransferase YhbS